MARPAFWRLAGVDAMARNLASSAPDRGVFAADVASGARSRATQNGWGGAPAKEEKESADARGPCPLEA